MAAADESAPGVRPDRLDPPADSPSSRLKAGLQHSESLPAAVRSTAQQIAGQLVTSLDRLEAVEAALSPDSTAGVVLEHAQQAIRSAAALAGRLAELAGSGEMESNGKSREFREPSPQGAASILLVDDDDSVRASLVALLRARGADVAAAADGQAAIQLFQEWADEIDAVVLDQNMPAMNGTSVLRELRAIRPDIKVVISSGGLIEPWDEQVDGCNRLAFAQKALGPHELIAQLERLLERKL